MNKASVDIVSGRTGENTCLVFSGDLIFENISIVKQLVDDFLSNWNEQEICLKMNDVTALDLSFLQLLEVVGKHLAEKEIDFSTEWQLEHELLTLLKQTGFEKYT